VKVKVAQSRVKRLRRCLNPECAVRVAGGKMPLRTTWVKEFVRLECPKCGAIAVFNPVGKVPADSRRDVYVARDGRNAVEHIFPKSRVLVPAGIFSGR